MPCSPAQTLQELKGFREERAAVIERSRRVIWAARLLAVVLWAGFVVWQVLHDRAPLPSQLIITVVAGCLLGLAVFGLGAYSRWTQARLERTYARQLEGVVSQLQVLSSRDSLTGLYNHGYLLTRLDEEVARARRYRRPLSVIILDLDQFKVVNDRYGHLAGDAILQTVAAGLQRETRAADILARYGGDEFCLILPETGAEGADSVAAKLAEATSVVVEKLGKRWPGLFLSFSWGVASYPRDGTTSHALLAAADTALYQRKTLEQNGRTERDTLVVQRLFYHIGEVIGQDSHPEEKLTGVSAAICEALNLRGCAVRSTEQETTRVLAWYFTDQDLKGRLRSVQEREPLQAEEGPPGRAALEQRIITVERVAESEEVPARFRSSFPEGLWLQCAPVTLAPGRQAVLEMYGLSGEAAPPDHALARSVSRLVAGAIQNAENFTTAKRQRDELTALADVAGLLLAEGPFQERMEAVAKRISSVTGYHSVTVDTYDPTGRMPYLRSAYSRGPLHLLRKWREVRPPIENEIVRNFFAALDQPYAIEDLWKGETISLEEREVLRAGGLISAAIVPLRFQDELLGLLGVASTEPGAFDEADLGLLTTIGNQIAPVIKVALLNTELSESHLGAIVRLAHAAEARDPFTGQHLQRIKAYCEAIGERLGLSEGDQKALGLASVMHDLGKLRIPDSILLKAGELSEDEWQTMKMHPIYGEEILGTGAFYEAARQVVRSHHERWDGSGYPDRLKGEEIPTFARIVAVADTFDVLTSRRPYKDAGPAELAVELILAERGQKFDPEVVDAFKALWDTGRVREILERPPPPYARQQGEGQQLAA